MKEKTRNLTFTEHDHRYQDETGLVYTSVTTLIERFKPKFDKHYWAEKKAKERGVSKEQILREWDAINKEACDRGGERHDFIETRVNEKADNTLVRPQELKLNLGNMTSVEEFDKSDLRQRYPTIHEGIRKIMVAGYTPYAEKRVYWVDYMIAGMIDLLFVNDQKEFIILDWKTNKDMLMFKSGYFRKGVLDRQGERTGQWVRKYEYMFNPLAHIENCKGSLYTLQLSLYAYICELWGLKHIKSILCHIREGYPITTESGRHILLKPRHGGHKRVVEVDSYTIPYWREEAKAMLEHNIRRQTRKPKYLITPNK